jgi:hypothetical protein
MVVFETIWALAIIDAKSIEAAKVSGPRIIVSASCWVVAGRRPVARRRVIGCKEISSGFVKLSERTDGAGWAIRIAAGAGTG